MKECGITGLPNHWIEDYNARIKAGIVSDLSTAAGQLEAALPHWTKITDGPDTWPDDGQDILLSIGEGFLEIGEWSGNVTKYIDLYYWRPLCDLDRPPETE